MSEMIVRLTDRHIKVKGGEYVQDIVRCQDCKYWSNGDDVYGICFRCPNTRQMKADDFCSYGCREERSE